MSEPCEHEKEGAAWIWQATLNLVKAERDAAQAKVANVEALLARLDAEAARSLTDWHTELLTGLVRDALGLT